MNRHDPVDRLMNSSQPAKYTRRLRVLSIARNDRSTAMAWFLLKVKPTTLTPHFCDGTPQRGTPAAADVEQRHGSLQP